MPSSLYDSEDQEGDSDNNHSGTGSLGNATPSISKQVRFNNSTLPIGPCTELGAQAREALTDVENDLLVMAKETLTVMRGTRDLVKLLEDMAPLQPRKPVELPGDYTSPVRTRVTQRVNPRQAP